LFRSEPGQVQVSRLLTPFEEALLLDEQDDPQAVEFYREAIAAGDNIAEAYCNLGIIELDRGNMVGTLDSFTQALKHDRVTSRRITISPTFTMTPAIFCWRDCITKRRGKSNRISQPFTTTSRWSITVWPMSSARARRYTNTKNSNPATKR
jgi:hypothetical protein